MKMQCKVAFIAWLIFVELSGCDMAGGTDSVKFDATSTASSLESLQKMTAGMSEEPKKAFVEGTWLPITPSANHRQSAPDQTGHSPGVRSRTRGYCHRDPGLSYPLPSAGSSAAAPR